MCQKIRSPKIQVADNSKNGNQGEEAQQSRVPTPLLGSVVLFPERLEVFEEGSIQVLIQLKDLIGRIGFVLDFLTPGFMKSKVQSLAIDPGFRVGTIQEPRHKGQKSDKGQ